MERLEKILSEQPETHIMVLYGPAMDDLFINADLEIFSIEHALVNVLSKKGFQRIVFYAPQRGIFFLDQVSDKLARPNGIVSSQEQVIEDGYERMKVLKGGPYQDKMFIRKGYLQQRVTPDPMMGDVHAIRLMDSMMKEQGNIRSAIVFMQAETTQNFFDDPRTLSGVVGEWFHLPAENRNLCIFLFSADTFNDLVGIATRTPIPEVRTFIQRGRTSTRKAPQVTQIGNPGKDEIARILRYWKAQKHREIPRDQFELFCTWMEAEDEKAKVWLSRLENVDTLNKEVFREKQWVSAYRENRVDVQARLDRLVGLKEIKHRLYELSAWVTVQKQLATDHKNTIEPPLLHMMFSGNPGTGKTSVARLVGEIFHDLGILKKGHLVEVSAVDLIAEYMGGTAIKTNEVVDQAIDGVLFIDEAYALSEKERGGFGQEAIDQLIIRMEEDRNRLVIIVAGYPEKMETFRRSNPGLARRIPEDNCFVFPDYSPQELSEILTRLLQDRDIPVQQDLKDPLFKVVEHLYDTRDETFGNAGEMRNLCDVLERRRAVRIFEQKLPHDTPATIEDMPERFLLLLGTPEQTVDQLLAELDQLVGLNPVKQSLQQMFNKIRFSSIRSSYVDTEKKKPGLMNMVFLGNPGTGKTTVARLIGKIYRSMGLLSKGHCVEVSRVDLVAGYVGQSAIKTMGQIRKAIDGVLFIDEAYSLLGGAEADYGREVVDTLVKAMEDNRDRLVVIVAGYPREMEMLLNSNPGLKSRFGLVVDFPDFELDELIQILLTFTSKEGYQISEPVEHHLRGLFYQVKKHDPVSFGNARFVREVYEKMKGHLADRFISANLAEAESKIDPRELSRFVIEDVPDVEGFLKLKPRDL